MWNRAKKSLFHTIWKGNKIRDPISGGFRSRNHPQGSVGWFGIDPGFLRDLGLSKKSTKA